MKTIWKFTLKDDPQEIQEKMMPMGAQILSVQYQNKRPTIWALVDSNAPAEFRVFINSNDW